MKATVVHDEQGAIRGLAVFGGGSKLQVQFAGGPDSHLAEVELPVKVEKQDFHSGKLHARLREVLQGHKVIEGKLVAISKK